MQRRKIKISHKKRKDNLNSYRFVSGEEPSDRMLRCLMREVARDATMKRRMATEKYFSEMRKEAEVMTAKWDGRIKASLNGQL